MHFDLHAPSAFSNALQKFFGFWVAPIHDHHHLREVLRGPSHIVLDEKHCFEVRFIIHELVDIPAWEGSLKPILGGAGQFGFSSRYNQSTH